MSVIARSINVIPIPNWLRSRSSRKQPADLMWRQGRLRARCFRGVAEGRPKTRHVIMTQREKYVISDLLLFLLVFQFASYRCCPSTVKSSPTCATSHEYSGGAAGRWDDRCSLIGSGKWRTRRGKMRWRMCRGTKQNRRKIAEMSVTGNACDSGTLKGESTAWDAQFGIKFTWWSCATKPESVTQPILRKLVSRKQQNARSSLVTPPWANWEDLEQVDFQTRITNQFRVH